MLDGRIDTQGSVSELRKRGILQEIASQEKAEHPVNAEDVEVDDAPEKDKKKARKLVEEEERAQGRVKWNIYVSYIKASYVIIFGVYHNHLTVFIKSICHMGRFAGIYLFRDGDGNWSKGTVFYHGIAKTDMF